MADQVRDRRPPGRDDHTGLPSEQHDRGNGKDEAQRHAAGIDTFHGHRETLGKNHAEEESRDRQSVGGGMRRLPVRDAGRHNRRDPRQNDGGHDRKNSRRYGARCLHRPATVAADRGSGADPHLEELR